jgi:hypothetical protein
LPLVVHARKKRSRQRKKKKEKRVLAQRERERESPNQFLVLRLHIGGCGRFYREKKDLQREKTVLERVGV